MKNIPEEIFLLIQTKIIMRELNLGQEEKIIIEPQVPQKVKTLPKKQNFEKPKKILKEIMEMDEITEEIKEIDESEKLPLSLCADSEKRIQESEQSEKQRSLELEKIRKEKFNLWKAENEKIEQQKSKERKGKIEQEKPKEKEIIQKEYYPINELIEIDEQPLNQETQKIVIAESENSLFHIHPTFTKNNHDEINYKVEYLPRLSHYVSIKKNYFIGDETLHYVPYLGDDDNDNDDPPNIEIVSPEEMKKMQEKDEKPQIRKSNMDTINTMNYIYCDICDISYCDKHGVENNILVEKDIIHHIKLQDVVCTSVCELIKDGNPNWNKDEINILLLCLQREMRDTCRISWVIVTKSCKQIQKEIKRLKENYGNVKKVYLDHSWKDKHTGDFHPTDYTPCRCIDGCTESCPCYTSNNFCHAWCNCPETCKNRVGYCNCKGPCNSNCICFSSFKECDTTRCKCTKGCNNKKLSLGNSKFISLGISKIHGKIFQKF